MAQLPLELLLDVAVFLDTKDLLNAASACKAWRRLLNDTPQLWQHPDFALSARWKSISTDSQGHVPYVAWWLDPPPRVISSRLHACSVLSLRLTLELDEIDCIPAHINTLTRSLVILQFSNSLHLIVEGVDARLVDDLVRPLSYCLKVSRLSLGTDSKLLNTLAFFQSFPRNLERLKRIDRVEIYPAIAGHSNFDSSPAISLSAGSENTQAALNSVTAVGALLPAFPVLPDEIEVAVANGLVDVDEIMELPTHEAGPLRNSVSLFIPDKLYQQWKEWDIRELDISHYRSLQITGGSWKLVRDAEAPYLERLSCKNLWKLVCRQRQRHLPRLAFLELSFHHAGKTKWGDIAHFLQSTLVPSIEVINIAFPTSSIDGNKHETVDVAWKEKISKMHQLRELTLVNYLPSTFSAICDSDDCRRSIEKIVLANDILPRDFFTAFVPARLPYLIHFDLSQARIHGGACRVQVAEWIALWKACKIKLFKPPAAPARWTRAARTG